MNKKAKAEVILIIILIILLTFSLYYFYISDFNSVPIKLSIKNKPSENETSFDSDFQHYKNMRFSETRLRVYINDICSQEKETRIKQALTRLEQETEILEFYQTNTRENAEIIAECEETSQEIPGKYFIAGEGGPTKIINTSGFFVIEDGKILLYYSDSRCDNYNIELHELLHVFGFKHSENKNSIMYNATDCNQVLTNDIKDELKRLYSFPSLPDLYLTNVSAIKKGRYLNFSLTIKNKGLKIAENIKLEIYADNEKFEEHDLGDINYGAGKIFEAGNLKLPSRNIENIKFEIKAGQELNKENNIINLEIPE